MNRNDLVFALPLNKHSFTAATDKARAVVHIARTDGNPFELLPEARVEGATNDADHQWLIDDDSGMNVTISFPLYHRPG